jgi:hypothetical protein
MTTSFVKNSVSKSTAAAAKRRGNTGWSHPMICDGQESDRRLKRVPINGLIAALRPDRPAVQDQDDFKRGPPPRTSRA